MMKDPQAKSLRIGQVARLASVGVETVRFYEREGLLVPPPRARSGYRSYPPDSIRRLRFIRRAKDLGFTLKEIRELLEMRVSRGTKCADVKEQALSKVREMEEKIRTLERMKRALTQLAAACGGQGPTSECPILDALDQQEDDYARDPPGDPAFNVPAQSGIRTRESRACPHPIMAIAR